MVRRRHRQLLRAQSVGACLVLLAAGAVLLPRSSFAANVDQGSTVTLDDFTRTSKDGSVMTIKHAEFQGANLSRDEIVKLLTPETPAAEEKALLQKLKVAAVKIPLIDLAPKEGGAIHIHDVSATDIDSGKVGKFNISSIDGSGEDADGMVSIKSGPFQVEAADFADVLAATGDPKQMSPVSHLGRLSWTGVDVVAPDTDSGAGKSVHVALGSLEIRNSYEGDALKDGSVSISALTVEPSEGSEFAASLAQFGYSRLDLGAKIALHYDLKAKRLSVEDFTVTGAGAGALGFKAIFEGIEPALFSQDAAARLAAVASAAVSSLEIKFVNDGIFERLLKYVAVQQKTSPDDLKKAWVAAAGQMLPAVLGGDPASLEFAAQAQKFIATPLNFTVAVRPKSGAFKLSDAMALDDPMAALSGIDITATANK